ncbi:MAG: twin-arginine translocase subunit TatC [Acidimicrobiales bacterium]
MAIHTPRRANRPLPDSMTLVEHLTELRRRLIIAVLAGLVAGIVVFALYNPVLDFLMHPYCASLPHGHACQLYINSPLQGFSVRIKIAAYGGIFLASPIILWQVWRFITPGLNPNEKRYAVPFVITSIALFTAGAAAAYAVSPKALHFLNTVGGQNLHQLYTPTSYLSFIVLLMVAFGIAFEMPVVLISLELAGVITPARLSSWRRKAIVIIFALSAIFIPSSDPFSLFAMAIPMCAFYEGAIIVGKVLRR